MIKIMSLNNRYNMTYKGPTSTPLGKDQQCVTNDGVHIGVNDKLRTWGRLRKRRSKQNLESNTKKKSKVVHKCSLCRSRATTGLHVRISNVKATIQVFTPTTQVTFLKKIHVLHEVKEKMTNIIKGDMKLYMCDDNLNFIYSFYVFFLKVPQHII